MPNKNKNNLTKQKVGNKKLPLSASIQEIQRSTNTSTQNVQLTQGSPEMVALLSDKLSPEGEKKALEITDKREDNNENERKRQYDAFNKIENKKFYGFLIVFFALIGLDIFLYLQGRSQIANYLTTALCSSFLGFIGGRGYEKSQQ